jgi:hypothetical protein
MLNLNWLQQKRYRNIVTLLLLPALVIVSSDLTVSELQAQAIAPNCSAKQVLDQSTNTCVDCIPIADTGCTSSTQCCGSGICDVLVRGGVCGASTGGIVATVIVYFVIGVIAGRRMAYTYFSPSGSQPGEVKQITVNEGDTAEDVAVKNGLTLAQANTALRAAQDAAVQHAITTGTSVDVAYSGAGVRIGTPSATVSGAIDAFQQARASGSVPSGPVTPGKNAASDELTKPGGLLAQKALENWPTGADGEPMAFDTMTDAIAADNTGDLARLAVAIASQVSTRDSDADAKTVQKEFIDAVMGTNSGKVNGEDLFNDGVGGAPAGKAYLAAAQATKGQIRTAIGQSPYAQQLRTNSSNYQENYTGAQLDQLQADYVILSPDARNLSFALNKVSDQTVFNQQLDRSYVTAANGFRDLYGSIGIDMTTDGYYPRYNVPMSGL